MLIFLYTKDELSYDPVFTKTKPGSSASFRLLQAGDNPPQTIASLPTLSVKLFKTKYQRSNNTSVSWNNQ
jgi:hypothetical protein